MRKTDAGGLPPNHSPKYRLQDSSHNNSAPALPGAGEAAADESILEAVATAREATAQAETKNIPLCVLSLEFQETFDKISHQYLFIFLKSYGLGEWFIDRIKHMYENAASSVQINGYIARPIPIRCAGR